MKWVTEHGRVVMGREARPNWIDGVILDLSGQMEAAQVRDRAEAKLRHETGHDALTGLPNRTLILDRAEQMLLRSNGLISSSAPSPSIWTTSSSSTTPSGAGRGRADQVGGRPAIGVMRASDTVGRLGGDEFVILAEGVSLAPGRSCWPRGSWTAERALPHRRVRGDSALALGEHRDRDRTTETRRTTCSRRGHCAYQAKARGKNCLRRVRT